jgi:hypothetical protein
MTEKTKVTVAGDWSKPAQILIEKISDAIGGALRPWQTERVARAEARASLMRAESDILGRQMLELAGFGDSPVGDRAIKRMVAAEVRKQINIEEIAHKAIEKLAENSRPQDLDEDFVADLFDKASSTSDEEMQSLWASILAGEANSPGAFSKRTVALVAGLDRRDAELFSKFCSCCWMFGGELTPLLAENSEKALEKIGVSFTDLVHLDALGLIRFDPVGGFVQQLSHAGQHPALLIAHYFESQVRIEFSSEPHRMDIGKALLTESGAQLAQISGAVSSREFMEAGITDMIRDHISIFSLWPRQRRVQ